MSNENSVSSDSRRLAGGSDTRYVISVSPRMWTRLAAKRRVYPASTSPGLDASAVGITRSSPASPVSASSWSGSPLRSSRSRMRTGGRGGGGRGGGGGGGGGGAPAAAPRARGGGVWRRG